MRGANAPAGFKTQENSFLELFLPDIGLDNELRLLFGRSAERKKHVGQIEHRGAEVRNRVGRDDRRSSCLRVDFRLVIRFDEIAAADETGLAMTLLNVKPLLRVAKFFYLSLRGVSPRSNLFGIIFSGFTDVVMFRRT